MSLSFILVLKNCLIHSFSSLREPALSNWYPVSSLKQIVRQSPQQNWQKRDELVCVQQVGIEDVINADRKVIVITDQGLSLGFPLLEVGELKKTSRGVKGITLIGDDLVKHAGFVTPDMERIDFDGKAINPKKIRSRKRAAKGQKSQIGTK